MQKDSTIGPAMDCQQHPLPTKFVAWIYWNWKFGSNFHTPPGLLSGDLYVVHRNIFYIVVGLSSMCGCCLTPCVQGLIIFAIDSSLSK